METDNTEEMFRIIFENALDGILLADFETKKFIISNPAICRMLGYSSEEITQLGVMDIHPEADIPYVIEQFEKGVRTENSLAADIPVKRKDGTIFYADIKISPVEIAGKTYALGISRDVTERRKNEQALRKNKEFIENLIEAMNDGFSVLDAKGVRIMANSAFYRMTDFSEEELINAGPPYPFWPPEYMDDIKAAFDKMKRREASDFELTFMRKNGERFPVIISTSCVKNEQGEITNYLVIFRDITRRKKAEELLRQQENKYHILSQEFQALLDTIPDGIVHLSPDLRIIWANKTLMKQVGPDEEAHLTGKHCYEAFWNYKMLCDQCSAVRSVASSSYESGNIVTPDGKILELRAVPIIGKSGSVESIIEVIRDITEHRKLEEQLRQALKMEAVGQLAGGIAHDFNNILTAIIGYGQVTLMRMEKDDPHRLNIDHILEAADRAAHLTNDLLLFSRKHISDRKHADLNKIIEKMEKFLKRVIGEDIECKTILHGQPIHIQADVHQLEQVLMNLATNARDAMPQGGTFTVTTAQVDIHEDFISAHGYGRPGTYAVITISDTGKGMDHETSQRIFDPFFTTKDAGKGTGLGLAVVYGIIKQHDGYINVYSEPGTGTTFRIYLPVIAAGEYEHEKAPDAEQPSGGTETILLAEDDDTLRYLAKIVLEQVGYQVIAAVDGADAVKQYIENKDRVQILLLDLVMPKMSGKEAYDEIRKITPDIKTVFVSGYAPDMIRQKMLLDIGMSIMFKPVAPMELLKKVRNVLDGIRG